MEKYSRIVGSLLVVAFGTLAVLDSTQLPGPRSGAVLGPGFLPLWVGAVVILLGAWQLITALQVAGTPAGRGAWPEGKSLGRVGLMLLGLAVYVSAANLLGFLFSTWIYLVAAMRMLALYPWRIVLAGGFLGSLVITAIFKVWLTLPLPGGPIGW